MAEGGGIVTGKCWACHKPAPAGVCLGPHLAAQIRAGNRHGNYVPAPTTQEARSVRITGEIDPVVQRVINRGVVGTVTRYGKIRRMSRGVVLACTVCNRKRQLASGLCRECSWDAFVRQLGVRG